MTKSSIWYWEKRRTAPEVHYLPRIIDFLGYCPYMPGRPLYERLRLAREAQGLPLRHLARIVHVDPCTLWRWEQGLGRPTKGRLAVVANAILGLVDFKAALERGRIGRPASPAEIAAIRRLRADGLTLREISTPLGVAPNTARKYSW